MREFARSQVCRLALLALMALTFGSIYADNGVPNPDAFGYRSSGTLAAPVDADAPAFNFEDISGTGTLQAQGDDTSVGPTALGFTFNFYGAPFTDCFTGSNGFVSFGAGSTSLANQAVPVAGAPNNLVAGFWDDLDPGSAGTVHHQTLGAAPNRRFIVQWTGVPHFATGSLNTFQIKLFETTNDIEVHYTATTADAGADATIGIENGTGTVGILYRFTPIAVTAGTAVRFFLPPPVVPFVMPDDDPDRNARLKGCFVDSVSAFGAVYPFGVLALLGVGFLLYRLPHSGARASRPASKVVPRFLALALFLTVLATILQSVLLHESIGDRASVTGSGGARGSDSVSAQSAIPIPNVVRQAVSKFESHGYVVTSLERVPSGTGGESTIAVRMSADGSETGLPFATVSENPDQEEGSEGDSGDPSPGEGGSLLQESSSESEANLSSSEVDVLSVPMSEEDLSAMVAMLAAHRDQMVALWTERLNLTGDQADALRTILLGYHSELIAFRTRPPADLAGEISRIKGLGSSIWSQFRNHLTADQRVILDPLAGM